MTLIRYTIHCYATMSMHGEKATSLQLAGQFRNDFYFFQISSVRFPMILNYLRMFSLQISGPFES